MPRDGDPEPHPFAMISIRILGTFGVRDAAGEPVPEVSSAGKRGALLALLALQGRGGVLSRDRALGLLWGDQPEDKARASLRSTLWALRSAVGKETIQGRGRDGLLLAPEAGVDLWAFREALEAGDPESALGLYSGPLLEGFHLSDAPELSHVLDGERETVRREALAAARVAAARATEAGREHEAIRWTRREAELAPFDERVHRRLMEVLEEAGDRAGALRVFERLRTRLSQALETEPDPQTAELARSLAGRDAGALPDPPPVATGAPVRVQADEPSLETDGPDPRGRAGTWRAPAALGAALVGILLFLTLRGGGGESGASVAAESPGEAPPAVAVLPFEVLGGERFQYLGDGMVELLSARLDLPGALRATDPRRTLATVGNRSVEDPEVAARMARSLGAERFVLGTAVDAGSQVHLSAALHDDTGAVLASVDAEVPPEELARAVDELARQLVAEVLGPQEVLSRTATRTAPSVAALRSYLQGEAAYRDGRFEESMDHFSAAIAEDSSYALAYYGLARNGAWLGSDSLIYVWLDRALEPSGGLPPRVELLVRATQRFREGDLWEARRLYRRILARYPDDLEARYELADMAFHHWPARGIPIQEVRPEFEEVLALDATYRPALHHLLRIASLEGSAVEVDTLSARLQSSRDWRRPEVLGLHAMARGEEHHVEEALGALALLTDDDAMSTVWRLVNYAPEPQAALPFLTVLADPGRAPTARAFGAALEAWVAAGSGRLREAWRAVARAERLDPATGWVAAAHLAVYDELGASGPPRPVLASGGLELVGTGETRAHAWVRVRHDAMFATLAGILAVQARDEATRRAALEVLEQQVLADGPAMPAAARYSVELLEILHQESSEGPGSATGLEDWIRRGFHSHYTAGAVSLVIGGLLEARGDEEEALGWYHSTVHDQAPGAHVRALGHLRAGRLLARSGRPAEAVREYERFLHLWRDHDDLGTPLVQEVRREVAALGAGAPSR